MKKISYAVSDFDRQKIYENLAYQPEPSNYSKKIHWVIQQQIAATNGKLYRDLIGRLDKYPIPDLPVKDVRKGLMLDIGCGWGRWLIAGAKKGYVPIGLDIRLEFCLTARKVLSDLGYPGYVTVADLRHPPFKSDIFDLIWSFSALQHVHEKRLLDCLSGIKRTLAGNGFCLLQLPNKNGIVNRVKYAREFTEEKNDYNSWCVRYYSPEEYRKMFEKIFDNFTYENQSFIGLGILPSDLKYVSFKNKLFATISVLLSRLTETIAPLKQFSDSIYVKSFKNGKADKNTHVRISKFFASHNENPYDNLNIKHLISCPVTGGETVLNETGTEFISEEAGLAFPVINGVPILIKSEARRL